VTFLPFTVPVTARWVIAEVGPMAEGLNALLSSAPKQAGP
jgi:hypothetical protein